MWEPGARASARTRPGHVRDQAFWSCHRQHTVRGRAATP
jgi:hypothetical protein